MSVPPKPGTAPVADPVGGGDATSEVVPGADIAPPEAGPSTEALTALAGALAGKLTGAQVALARAEKAYTGAHRRVAQLRSRLRLVDERLRRLGWGERFAVSELAAASETLAERAADAYIRSYSGGDSQRVLLESETANEYGQRRSYLDSLLESVESSVQDYATAGRDLSADLRPEAVDQAELRLDLQAALRTETRTGVALLDAHADLFAVGLGAMSQAGTEVVANSFVFPVAGAHQFVDSFGAPRMVGTGSEHFHEGTDVMAAAGTPLVACERSVVTRMSSNVLGGITVWLKGASGTSYYYAHLATYAPALEAGSVIDPGTLVGLVGNTGNARTTAPHLHFEVHPNGGEAINPYPLLVAADT
ncbi:MAG: peptidoglycan DD-metalloendopeptidase family protein [Acidimicrobiales bacterium]